ncbi:MAG: restriction endonuclease subunit S [Candidatus Anammoxibacter sp.]
MAKTLYDYWFVQFDFPISKGQAKTMNNSALTGKPYKSSGGKMVYNDTLKREIPDGWEKGTLGDIGVNIKNGIKATEIDPQSVYIGLEHIPRKKIVLDIWSKAVAVTSNKFAFKKRDILFGKLRPYFHKVGVAFVTGICSTDILVLNSKYESNYGLFAMVVSSDDFIQYVSSAMEGTRMPRTKWEYMKEYSVAIPHDGIAHKFNNILKPVFSQMEVNVHQNQQLAQRRDWLLPMLMNGQVTVK